jgi:hypothetical protein
MNEKILELAEQAKIDYDLRPEIARAPVWIGTDEELAKFAELIVRECSRVIVNGGYWSGGPIGPKRQCTPPEIAQMIKEHFGVEE